MKGAHDLGGKPDMGPINPESEMDEPVFHAEWERRVFAMTLATGMLGQWNIDESRFARERQDPIIYLGNSYYENWLAGLETLLSEKGLLEMEGLADLRVPTPSDAQRLLATGGPTLLSTDKQPIYNIGDTVRVRDNNSTGHTRAPEYAQGRIGIVTALRGCHIFPDSHIDQETIYQQKTDQQTTDRQTTDQQTIGQHLYSVQFSERELWQHSQDNADVLIDLWEPYLELVN